MKKLQFHSIRKSHDRTLLERRAAIYFPESILPRTIVRKLKNLRANQQQHQKLSLQDKKPIWPAHALLFANEPLAKLHTKIWKYSPAQNGHSFR